MSNQQNQNENLSLLKKDISDIKALLNEKLPTLNNIGSLLQTTDEVTPGIEAKFLNLPRPSHNLPNYGVIIKQDNEAVYIHSANGDIQRITAVDLLKLDKDDQDHIQVYKDRMDYLYNLWKRVSLDIDKSTDLLFRAQSEEQLNDLAKKMCVQLRNILDFLEEQLHLSLIDHYRKIRDVCRKHNQEVQ